MMKNQAKAVANRKPAPAPPAANAVQKSATSTSSAAGAARPEFVPRHVAAQRCADSIPRHGAQPSPLCAPPGTACRTLVPPPPALQRWARRAAPDRAVPPPPRRDYLTRGPPRNIFEAAEAGDKQALVKFAGDRMHFATDVDAGGRTCLHWAAENGHLGVIEHLMDEGADIRTKDRFNARTAVHVAAMKGQARALRFMLTRFERAYSEMLVNEVDKHGCTPAFLAYELGPDGERAFKLLLEHGARWNALDLEEQMRRVQEAAKEAVERRRFADAMARLEAEAAEGGATDGE